MAVKTWVGAARRINMKQTITIGSATNTETFTVSFKHPSNHALAVAVQIATHTASGDTTSTIAADLKSQLEASNHEFAKALTFTVSSAVITIEANVAGVPFVCSVGGTGTITLATVTANSGPNDFGVASNWLNGVVPVANDDVYIEGESSILYGLNQTSYSVDTLTIRNFKGGIGWANAFLAIGVEENLIIDAPSAQTIYLDVTDVQGNAPTAAIDVYATGSRGAYGLYLDCGNALGALATVARFRGGKTLFTDWAAGENGVIGTCDISGGAVLHIGQGAVATVMNVNDGDVKIVPYAVAPTTLVMARGSLQIDGALAVTTATINGGLFIPNSTGTITTLNINGGMVDFTQSRNARTVTTANLDQAGSMMFETAYLTVSTFNRTGPILYSSALLGASQRRVA